MQIYKDRGSLSGFRMELPTNTVHPLSHLGEYQLVKDHLVPWHTHSTWELLLQVEGTTRWQFGRQQIQVQEGELLICPPQLPHAKTQSEAADYRFYFVGCRMDPDLWSTLRPHLPVTRMSKLPEARETAKYFRILEEELLLHPPQQATGIKLAWKQLWLAIYRLAENPGRVWNREDAWLVQRVRTLVEADLGERWALATVARLMGYSPNHFATRFQRESGQSFHQYLTRARIEAAQAALTQGEETATEIGLRFGFSSSQHFSRVFAKETGHPPSRWKKRTSTVRNKTGRH